MLKSAILYRDELNFLIADNQYNEKFKFLTGGPNSDTEMDFQGNQFSEPFRHQYVSIDSNNSVIGYIGFSIEYSTKSAYNFHAFNFRDPNVTYTKDVITILKDCFYKFGCERIEFRCIDGNPVLNTYRKFIYKYGGTECAHLHRCSLTWDGVIRDAYMFEILKENFKI